MKKAFILLALVAATALVTTSCESKKATPEVEQAPVEGAVESDSTAVAVEEVAAEEAVVEEVK
jgi:hypothetical protein